MSGQLSPELLVPYIAAAARELRNEGSISDRSAWALDDALAQMESFAEGTAKEPRALISSVADEGPALSVLVLAADASSDRALDVSPREHERSALAKLSDFRRDVERLRNEDREAASRLQPRLDRIVQDLVSHPPTVDLS